MLEKQEGFQFHPKKYVADNIVQAMDWDARGMYMHLLCMAYQEKPQGSIPNDDAAIRRWLNLAHGSEENLRVWRRVRPQIMAAFQLQDGRWFQKGLCTTLERQRRKSDSSANNVRKRYENTMCSLEEVISYCKERKNKVDPQKWFDYYSANGWKVGKNPMKDWRAAVRTWETNGYGSEQHRSQKPRESAFERAQRIIYQADEQLDREAQGCEQEVSNCLSITAKAGS